MLSLREAIEENHKLAERMPFNVRMFKGQLSEDEYLLHLLQQEKIFQAIEQTGLPHPDLSRLNAVAADIKELREKGATVGRVLPSTQAYATYLASLNYEQLLPHIYLNYMAIMFGGQMMKKQVPSTGKMYDFHNMKECIQSIRAVQQDAWADEVNKGFEFVIAQFKELESATTTPKNS
jgi:heme oxygenase